MKKLHLVMAALVMTPMLTAAACQPTPTSPAEIAPNSVLDEQAVIAVQLAYKTWRLAVESGVQTGLIKGARATQVRELDARLYAALQATESAYEARNAASFEAAVVEFHKIHASANQALGG